MVCPPTRPPPSHANFQLSCHTANTVRTRPKATRSVPMPQPFANLKFHLISDVSPRRQQQRLRHRHRRRRRSSCSSSWSQQCLVGFICLFLVSPLCHSPRITVAPHSFVYCLPLSVCRSHIHRCHSSFSPGVSFSFLVSVSSMSCGVPRVSQHPLWASFRCFPLTVCHSHILRLRSPVSCPFHPTLPDFPCAIPRVLQHLLCCSSFSLSIFLVFVPRIPPLFYVHSIYCFSYLTASPGRLLLAVRLSHISFISFHMREMLHA